MARTEAERLAGFVHKANFGDIPTETMQTLKRHILDSVGCAIGAFDAPPILQLRNHLADFGGRPLATVIGGTERTAPDRAALLNGALVRYLDFMDSYLAPGETCHPSDNLSSVLAAAEYANATGQELLTALAIAYQVHCRLSDEAPVRARGFDHTTQGAYAVAAGAAKALGLNETQTAHAIAISGTANVALRVTRTGALSHWKGLAYPHTAFVGTHAAFLAKRGITGPLPVFEGEKGFKEAISGPFEIDWENEGFDRIQRTIYKKYNAEIHAHTSLEAADALRHEHGLTAADIAEVEIEAFDVACEIIGGKDGKVLDIRTKEQADHSLQYMVAALLLDGQLMPAQYTEARILSADVQDLMRRITVKPNAAFSARFPGEMPVRVTFTLTNGRKVEAERSDYEGFHTRPMSWATVTTKFRHLAEPFADDATLHRIEEAVAHVETLSAREFAARLQTIEKEIEP